VKEGSWWYEEEEGEREDGRFRKEEKLRRRRKRLWGAPLVEELLEEVEGGEHHWPGSDLVEEREWEARVRRPP
jgi:hypothetical protein